MARYIDNSELIATLLPEQPEDDTFWYTELLDRAKKVGGNNRYRLLRTFKCHSRVEFMAQMPMIRELCDQTGIRAYMRLTPRSYTHVGKEFARRVLDAALLGRWQDMSHLYASSCGRCGIHGRKLWMYDVDELGISAALEAWLHARELLVAILPSRKGCHLIARPHDPADEPRPPSVELHKDNPTNLYIPAPGETQLAAREATLDTISYKCADFAVELMQAESMTGERWPVNEGMAKAASVIDKLIDASGYVVKARPEDV